MFGEVGELRLCLCGQNGRVRDIPHVSELHGSGDGWPEVDGVVSGLEGSFVFIMSTTTHLYLACVTII